MADKRFQILRVRGAEPDKNYRCRGSVLFSNPGRLEGGFKSAASGSYVTTHRVDGAAMAELQVVVVEGDKGPMLVGDLTPVDWSLKLAVARAMLERLAEGD